MLVLTTHPSFTWPARRTSVISTSPTASVLSTRRLDGGWTALRRDSIDQDNLDYERGAVSDQKRNAINGQARSQSINQQIKMFNDVGETTYDCMNDINNNIYSSYKLQGHKNSVALTNRMRYRLRVADFQSSENNNYCRKEKQTINQTDLTGFCSPRLRTVRPRCKKNILIRFCAAFLHRSRAVHFRRRRRRQLKTTQPDGLVLYIGGERDFLAVELVDGQVRYLYDLGGGPRTVRVLSRHSVSDGRWHDITVLRNEPAKVSIHLLLSISLSHLHRHV